MIKAVCATLLAAMLSISGIQAKEKSNTDIVDSTYFDFAMSFGTNIWPYIDWSVTPPVINETQTEAYLNSLFTQMKGAGEELVYLSFGQLDNIDVYASGNFLAPGVDITYDVIIQLLNQFQTSDVQTPSYANFLDFVCAEAKKKAMGISVAFGGANATNAAYKILNRDGETFAGQAQKLADFAKAYNIERLDFDIEDPTALSSQPVDSNGDTVVVFFETLHGLLKKDGKTMTLTSMLSLADWPNGALKPLFYNDAGQPIFTQLFDGLNMMGYSDTQYWLDPSNVSWGIEQWLDIIGKENAGIVHVGFNDGVHYAQASANGGSYKYTIAQGSTDGQAAAQIYQELQAQLVKDGYAVALGTPFFWPAADVAPNGKSRYSMDNQQSNFISQTMQDFYDTLKKPAGPRLVDVSDLEWWEDWE